MKIQQEKFTKDSGWVVEKDSGINDSAQLVLLFGETNLFADENNFKDIWEKYPNAHFLGSTTAGEIIGTNVFDDSIIATAIHFEKTEIKVAKEDVSSMDDSFNVGEKLGKSLKHENLSHVFVISDGLNVNGTELVNGLMSSLPDNVAVTGGLAGDQANFKQTYVVFEKNISDKMVVVCGLYGKHIKVGYGSVGGWDSFGTDRLVTRSDKNILYELDGKPALDLYKEYLGDQAKDLPGSGLLFPLSIKYEGKEDFVRTILAIDEKEKSLIFAGDIPQGSYARLMKANFERLIDGAGQAASKSASSFENFNPELAILISCVGRKLVLKQRVEEEVENVQKVLGEKTPIAGFYSYGEISPTAPTSKQCQLQNQTMTITIMKED